MKKKEKIINLKYKKKVLLRIFIFAIIVFVVYNFVTFYNKSELSTISYNRTKEVSYDFEGVLIRDEKIIDIDVDKKGIIDYVVTEDQMIKKDTLIANYYDTNIDEETRNKLNYINQQIAEIKSTPTESVPELNEKLLNENIENKYEELILISNERNISYIRSVKNEMEMMAKGFEKSKNEDKDEEQKDSLESLLEQKEKIESEIEGEKKEIKAPVHGIYQTTLDGYETLISIEKSKAFTVSEFENIKNKITAPVSGDNLAEIKIVDSYVWGISVCADESTAKNFSVGDEITVRFNENEKEVRAKIEYISSAKSGKCVITVISDNYSDYAMNNRFTNVTFVKNVYSGLYVPVKAIRVVDGKTGVYVKTENTVKYKEIEILYKDEKDAIVKIDNTKSNALLLYDEIIVD